MVEVTAAAAALGNNNINNNNKKRRYNGGVLERDRNIRVTKELEVDEGGRMSRNDDRAWKRCLGVTSTDLHDRTHTQVRTQSIKGYTLTL